MGSPTEPLGQRVSVAIIGGGASGTLTAAHLLRQAAADAVPLSIAMLDTDGRHGLGRAYSTTDPAHLLNAMAGQMSAVAGDPDHLIRWAASAAAAGSDAVTPASFLSRRAYGQYLLDTLAAAERCCPQPGRLIRLRAEAVAIRRPGPCDPFVVCTPGGQVEADAVVLATGSEPARLPFGVPDTSRVITDPWRPGVLAAVTDGSPVLVAGTGLTTLDLAVSIASASPRAIVHAVSRHGLLPRPHPGCAAGLMKPPPWPALPAGTGPVRLAGLLRHVRRTVAADPASWPAVIGSLRPVAPDIWRRMPIADQEQFLRHVARYWEIHRHLIPAATAGRISALRQGGRLIVHRGRVLSVSQSGAGLTASIMTGESRVQLATGWLINGTGATSDISTTQNPLHRSLFATGLARPDHLGLGLDATPDGRVVGAGGYPHRGLYALGPLLRGVRYETTAIPEIKEQAAALARTIVAGCRADSRAGSAA
jgi:uncharacterized NAD(P)/FAD-binding protein YdhS